MFWMSWEPVNSHFLFDKIMGDRLLDFQKRWGSCCVLNFLTVRPLCSIDRVLFLEPSWVYLDSMIFPTFSYDFERDGSCLTHVFILWLLCLVHPCCCESRFKYCWEEFLNKCCCTCCFILMLN